MNIFTNLVPLWVSILFLMVLPIPIFMITNLVKQALTNSNIESKKINLIFISILLFYFIYLSYASILSWNGIFSVNTLPPRVILFTTLPLILFFILVISRLEIYKIFLQNVKLESLVKVHVFRLIGVFFLILYFYDAIPKNFAFVAGFGDILTAILSIFVAKIIILKKTYAKKLTIFWNLFGILDIFSVLIAAVITTKLSIETGSQSVLALTFFPFCLIPAFAAATIIFLHISTFRKLFFEKMYD